MGISFTDFTGGSAKQNNFVINTGTSGNNVFELDRTYDPGSYFLSIVSGDTTYDVYAISPSGEYAGYTNSSTIDISDKFNKIVILGLPNNDSAIFEYRGVFNAPSATGSVESAGAYVTSVNTPSLPDIDDTTIVAGGNFATDVEVYFVGQDSSETAAKNIVRSSTNQLIVTRPDSLDPANAPFSIKVVNPGIPSPSGTNLFRLSNSITSGSIPAWSTDETQYWNVGQSSTISLLATDADAGSISYSGSLPLGFSLSSNGEITKDVEFDDTTLTNNDFDTFTVRATDLGGNYVDKEFTLTYNYPPTWTTSSLSSVLLNTLNSRLLSASGNATLSYSIVSGSLPTGMSLNSSTGEISGTPTVNNESVSFIVRATDERGAYSDKELSLFVQGNLDINVLVVAGGGGGGGGEQQNGNGGGGGGGGAGGMLESSFTIPIGSSFNVQVGAGGSGGGSASFNNSSSGAGGGTSQFDTITTTGGGGGSGDGRGGTGQGGSGGGGGGDSSGNGTGISGQGNNGAPGNGSRNGGGGGGAGSAGNERSGGNGRASSTFGSTFAGGGGGGAGGGNQSTAPGGSSIGGTGGKAHNGGQTTRSGNGVTSGTINTGSGGGGSGAGYYDSGQSGGSGVVKVRYPDSSSISVGPGLSSSTTTSGGYKITTFTGGTDTITFSQEYYGTLRIFR